jgi:hypothetical protein
MFLWFAAGASIPVIIHLLNRQKYRRVRWAAMDWLLAALQKTRKRVQFENWLLLLLRILIMLLIALAISRPFLSAGAVLPGEGQSGTHYIFAIDVTWSMEYKKGQKTSLEIAKDACERVISGLQTTAQDRFSLLLLSEYPDRTKQEWNNLPQVSKAVADISRVQHYRSNMGNTMSEIRKILQMEDQEAEEKSQRLRKIYFFTDMQASGWKFSDQAEEERLRSILKELALDKRNTFFLVDVGSEDAVNYSIVNLYSRNNILVTEQPVEIVAELYNFSSNPSPQKRVQFFVDGELYDTQTATLPPDTLVPITFQYTFPTENPGPHLFETRFDPHDPEGDYPEVDNRRFLAVDVRAAIRGLLVDGEPENGKRTSRETGAIEMVLDPFGDKRFFHTDWVTVPNLYDRKLDQYDFIALCNVKSLTRDLVHRIEEFTRHGGGLFLSLGDQVDTLWYNSTLGVCMGTIAGEFRPNDTREEVEEGTHLTCHKCGQEGVPVKERKEVPLEDGSGQNRLIHNGGLGLLPARIGKLEGSPPDLHQSGIPRRFSRVSFAHPVFSFFEEKLRAQPFGLIFWKYFRLFDPYPEGVLAELDDNEHTPILVERPWHDGEVILFGSAIDAEEGWNAGITGRPPYWVMVKRICDHLSQKPSAQRNFRVGEPLEYFLPYSAAIGKLEFRLFTPEGSSTTLFPEPPGDDNYIEIYFAPDLTLSTESEGPRAKGLNRAGGYTLMKAGEVPGDAPPLSVFSANVGPQGLTPDDLRFCENNLEHLTASELQEQYPEFPIRYLGEKSESGEDIELEEEQTELWRSILLALLGFLLAESFFAFWFGRGKQ